MEKESWMTYFAFIVERVGSSYVVIINLVILIWNIFEDGVAQSCCQKQVAIISYKAVGFASIYVVCYSLRALRFFPTQLKQP